MVKKATEATPNHLLRIARKERNWTQQEVADRIGSPQSFNISRWEQGIAFPSAHYIQQLCLLFGKTAKELGLVQGDNALLREPTTPSAILAPNSSSVTLWTVPYRRNPFFIDREQVLNQLFNTLSTSGAAMLTQTQAISGLGGVGKTQIAVEYAHRYRSKYRSVLWFRAATRDSILSDFMNVAALLDLPEQDEQDQHRVVMAVKGWLTHHQGWLLILDNADDLELAADFLPTGGSGHILLTTRAQATGAIAPTIKVEKMDQEDSTLLLLRRAKLLDHDVGLGLISGQDRAQAESIAAELDGLPLALDQAGAYIEETGCSLAVYPDLYRTHRRELLRRRGTLSSDHPEPVATTWALTFFKVEQANPAAADLLRLCAFLDPDAIPEEMITASASVFDSPLASAAADPFTLNEAIETLRKYSLLRRDPEAKVINMHRLVQAVLKDIMDDPTQRQWAERTVRAVNTAYPEVTFSNWKRCQQYLPHAQSCARLIEQHNLILPEAARLLTSAGCYLRERALYAHAEPLLLQALALRERVPGPAHPDTAVSLTHLALLYCDLSKDERAESLLQRALAIQEQALGPDHPDTAVSLTHLARLYQIQSQFRLAEPLFQRALAIRVQVLGPGHLDTVSSFINLLGIYYIQDELDLAEPLVKRALAIREQALGPEHPNTLNALNNLAMLYYVPDKLEQAESLIKRMLTVRELALGPEHSSVAKALHCLAVLYHLQGNVANAEPLYQNASTILQRMFGSEHPFVAQNFNNLAILYQVQGEEEKAELLLQRALAIWERALGPENHFTALSLNNLAMLYHLQGKYEQAESLYQRIMVICEKGLVPDLLDVATYLENYADLLRKRKQEAKIIEREDLE